MEMVQQGVQIVTKANLYQGGSVPMFQRITQLLLICMCCMLISSCSQEGLESTASSTTEPQTEPETITEAVQGPTVLSAILDVQPEALENFSYFDTPKLSDRDGVAFPVKGAQDITFECGSESLYKEEQDALTRRLAQALAKYPVGEESVAADGITLPTGRYFSIWPSLKSQWNPVLTFFDSGEIYVYTNGGRDGIDQYWHAEDPAQFDELLTVLEGIHDDLNALPLEYHLSMWLRHDYFKPESEALRIAFVNNGKNVVTAESLLLERKTENGWERIGEAETPDLAIAPYREYTMYAIDLTAIPGAREPGEYRVSGNLVANTETMPLLLEYTIADDADDLSSLPLPEMTPENQAYCERYVSMWGIYSPFETDFDENHYIPVSHPFHLYYIMAYAEGKSDEYSEYGVHVPGDILEGTIQRHFLFTTEQIRAWMPTKEQNANEYYDTESNTYHFEGGYGGVGYSAVVSDSRREDNLLTLTCDWYDYEDNYEFSQELTLRLGEDEYDFVYVAGRMLEDMG